MKMEECNEKTKRNVCEIGDLEHLEDTCGCKSGLVVLIDREQLRLFGAPFLLEDVVIIPAKEWKKISNI